MFVKLFQTTEEKLISLTARELRPQARDKDELDLELADFESYALDLPPGTLEPIYQAADGRLYVLADEAIRRQVNEYRVQHQPDERPLRDVLADNLGPSTRRSRSGRANYGDNILATGLPADKDDF